MPFWLELAKDYTRDEWRKAFRKYVLSHHGAPEIGDMRGELDSLFGARKAPKTSNRLAPVPYKVIDFCMDTFSPSEVTEAIRNCHPTVKTGRMSDLVGSVDWVKYYREAEVRMFELAMGSWEREGPPRKRFLKHELYERDWDLIGRPAFDEKGICTNKIDYSGKFYKENGHE